MAYLFKENLRVKIDSPSFSFSEDEFKRLKEFANFEKVSLSKFVSLALKDYLDEIFKRQTKTSFKKEI